MVVDGGFVVAQILGPFFKEEIRIFKEEIHLIF